MKQLEANEGLLRAIRSNPLVWSIVNEVRVGDVIEPALEKLKNYGYGNVTWEQFQWAKNEMCLKNIRCPGAADKPIV